MLRSLAPEMGSHSNDLEVMESTEVYYGIAISKDGEKTADEEKPEKYQEERFVCHDRFDCPDRCVSGNDDFKCTDY